MDYQDGYIGHSGATFGWQADMVHNAETGTTIAMGTNAGGGASLLFNAVRDLVTETLQRPKQDSSASTSGQEATPTEDR